MNAALKEIAQIIEGVDNRCAAADGPVTPTLREMTQKELSRIYKLAKEGSKDNIASMIEGVNGEMSPELVLVNEILGELQRARAKFPGENVTMLALGEEYGELCKASFEESREKVRKEAVQVATMAMRVVLDGDSTLDAWRFQKGLDPLVVP